MKSIGVVRKLDGLGRIVLPKELRKTMNMAEGDPIEIFVDNEYVMLKKYNASGVCMVTGEVSNENKEYSPGLILSPAGVKILLNKLEDENKN